jgi:hypothetical protein
VALPKKGRRHNIQEDFNMSATREQMVDRRFKEWESRTNRKATPSKAVEKVITITGEYGSMGDTVADLVSKELEFTLYDRKLIQMIAERGALHCGGGGKTRAHISKGDI